MRVLLACARRLEQVETRLDRELSRSRLGAPDRRLCQELVCGVVRWQRTLDWLIERKTAGRAQKAALQVLLRLGLYQIFWLDRVPDHAAVNESVALARQLGFGPQAGFVNAVLRGCLREREPTRRELEALKETQPDVGHSHPAWLVSRWKDRWGADQTRRLLEWNNAPPKLYARLNTLRTDGAALITQWRKEGVEYDFRRWDWTGENLVFELKAHPPLETLPSLRQGLFYVQDPSTLLAVRALAPEPGETVLDLCAAPGGKTSFIAQLMENRGRIVALDNRADRLTLLAENCARLGVTCVEVRSSASEEPSATPEPRRAHSPGGRHMPGDLPAKNHQGLAHGRRLHTRTLPEEGNRVSEPGSPGDVTVSPSTGGAGTSRAGESDGDSSRYDRVLVDVPCSNTGVMRRRVGLRWRIRPEEIGRLREVQLGLLRTGAAQVKPGGRLVYSTCSLEPEENTGIIAGFLAEHPAFRLEHERELLPFAEGVDGAYVAALTRAAE